MVVIVVVVVVVVVVVANGRGGVQVGGGEGRVGARQSRQGDATAESESTARRAARPSRRVRETASAAAERARRPHLITGRCRQERERRHDTEYS